MIQDEIILSTRTSEMTLKEVMEFVADYKKNNPDKQLFLDGDAHGIVARSIQ